MFIQTLHVCLLFHNTFIWAFEYCDNLYPQRLGFSIPHERSTIPIDSHVTSNICSNTDDYPLQHRDLLTSQFLDFADEPFNSFSFETRHKLILHDSQSVISLLGLDDQTIPAQENSIQHRAVPNEIKLAHVERETDQPKEPVRISSTRQLHDSQVCSQSDPRLLASILECHNWLKEPGHQGLRPDDQVSCQHKKMFKRKTDTNNSKERKMMRVGSGSESRDKTPLGSVCETQDHNLEQYDNMPLDRLRMRVFSAIQYHRRNLFFDLPVLPMGKDHRNLRGLSAVYLGKDIISNNETIFSNLPLLWYEINCKIKSIWKESFRLDSSLWDSIVSWKLEHGVFPLYIHKVSVMHTLFKDTKVKWPFQSEVIAFDSATKFFKIWIDKNVQSFTERLMKATQNIPESHRLERRMNIFTRMGSSDFQDLEFSPGYNDWSGISWKLIITWISEVHSSMHSVLELSKKSLQDIYCWIVTEHQIPTGHSPNWIGFKDSFNYPKSRKNPKDLLSKCGIEFKHKGFLRINCNTN
ncbi:hypothetical protein DFH28DRAFT_220145 [Melampsora americana]|nr:hypothetical protein DFH28DRAFT_220145 [Melampsora americana]